MRSAQADLVVGGMALLDLLAEERMRLHRKMEIRRGQAQRGGGNII